MPSPPKMPKSSPELVARFDELARFAGDVTRRPMFGYPSCVLNGHMFMSLFRESLVLRLGEADRAELLALPGAEQFEPMPGRPMTGFVLVPPDIVADDDAAAEWIARARAHAASLPPKAKKPAKKKA
jgi:TfoX/Sxy family transcriptional regulator of competence genes